LSGQIVDRKPSTEHTMKRLTQLAVAAALIMTPFVASAQSLTEAQARAVITPGTACSTNPSRAI
jgi:hypothetical protein